MPAKIEDTLQFSKKYKNIVYKRLATTGFTVSPVGFGSYRVHISVDTQQKALEHALLNGVNVIDTSSNYADGGSEELIGAVMKKLIDNKKLKREEIILVSKVGYLQGQNYQLSQQLKQQGRPFKDLVNYAQGLEHCMHPDFIADQLSRSLSRLQADCIDIYLLHNPEYYLMHVQKQGLDPDQARREYYRRIEQAFMHLEIEAANGRIQYYGISSNTFPVKNNRYDFTELQRIWEIAESISPHHKFRVIQFPMNVIEHQAFTEKNQPCGLSVLDFARDKNLGVLTNRPLNAFSKGGLTRLVSLETSVNFDPAVLKEHFEKLVSLENQFTTEIIPHLKCAENTIQELAGYFSSGLYLQVNYKKLGSYWTWLENQARFLAEQISYAVQQVNDLPDKNHVTIQWLDAYVKTFNNVLNHLTLYYGQQTANLNQQIFDNLKKNVPGLNDSTSLQQAAIRTLRLTKGISSVLTGMRQTDYVENILEEIRSDRSDELEPKDWLKIADILSDI